MRSKSIFLILIAVACGLVASIGISQVMDTGGLREAAVPTDKIYVAMSDLDIGKKLDENNLKLEAWPKDRIPQGAAKKLEEVKDKYPRQRFYPGEPILIAKLTDNPGANGIKIPEGHRVVSVKVDVNNLNTALLSPGDRVDVLAFLRRSADIPQTVAKTFIRDVCIFAVGSETERTVDKDGKSIAAQTVSLVVTPEQGRKVLLMAELGRLQLVMRRPDDSSTEAADDESETSITDILSKASEDGDAKHRATLGSPAASANETKQESYLEMLARQGLVAGVAGAISTPLPSEPIDDESFIMVVMNPEGQEVYRFKTPGELPTKIMPNTITSPPVPTNGKHTLAARDLIGGPVEITGSTTDGVSFDGSSYRGKTVLVMVWSTSCSGCRSEMPIVSRLHELYRERGLDVVGVSLDKDPQVLRKFLANSSIPWTNVQGPGAQELVTRFGIPSIPYFLLIDRDGNLITMGNHVTELAAQIDWAIKAREVNSSRADGTTTDEARRLPDETGVDDTSSTTDAARSDKEE